MTQVLAEGENGGETKGKPSAPNIAHLTPKLCAVTARDFAEGGDTESEKESTPGTSHDFECVNCQKTKTGTRFITLPYFDSTFVRDLMEYMPNNAYPRFTQHCNIAPNA